MKIVRNFRSALFLFLFLITASAASQTFFPVNGNMLIQEIPLNLAVECWIYFDNPSGDTLTLQWRSLEASGPASWTVDLCDYGACYTGVPDNSVMNPVYGATQPYLKLIVQAGAQEGSAWYWFRVQDKHNSANYQDVYFSLYTPEFVGSDNPNPVISTIYPNPCENILYIHSPLSEPADVRIYSLSGEAVLEAELMPGENRIDVSAFPAGPGAVYFNGRSRIFMKN